MLILSGILVMVIGLMLRFNALLVVVAAGFVTGLAGGLSINDIVGAIGEAFVKNRYMSLFILILPVIGLMERHGLRERAEILIGKINAATAGRIFMIYLFVRQVTVAFGINMSGMVAMVRPLIAPMSVCHYAAQKGNIKAGFMHIPYLPSQVVDKPNQPSMAVETVRATLETIVHVLAHGESYKAQDINYTTPHE